MYIELLMRIQVHYYLLLNVLIELGLILFRHAMSISTLVFFGGLHSVLNNHDDVRDDDRH